MTLTTEIFHNAHLLLAIPWFAPAAALGSLLGATMAIAIFESFRVRVESWGRFTASFVAYAIAFLAFGVQWLQGTHIAFGLLQFSRYSAFFSIIVTGLALLSLLPLRSRFKSQENHYSFLLLGTLGSIVFVHANDLLGLFLGLELATLPFILWLTVMRDNEMGPEIGLKYYLGFGLASAFFMVGAALLYMSTASTSLETIQQSLILSGGREALQTLGITFLLVGIIFKLAWVPFHLSVPDLYEGGDTTVIGFLSVASKLVGAAVCLRLLEILWSLPLIPWREVFALFTVLTALIGSLQVLPQNQLKRRLAYASVAQTAFILLALTTATTSGAKQEEVLTAILLYGLTYSFMIFGAFTVIAVLERTHPTPDIHDCAGLARRQPYLAACFTLFLIALAGLPPTLGFVSKYYIVTLALDAGLYALSLLTLLATLLAAYFCLDIVIQMYFREPQEMGAFSIPSTSLVILIICAFGLLYWGILPENLLIISGASVRGLIY